MSHKRSGLLPGLVIGLVAALICAAALGAAVLFQGRLPVALTAFGNGVPLSLALSLAIALLISLSMGAVRPRSGILPPMAALYAGGAVVAGQIAGSSIMIGSALRGKGTPADLADITTDNVRAGLPQALSLYREPLTETWPAWLYIAMSALAALMLVTLRVARVRRAQRTHAAEQAQEETQEPEYRAPFEPAQSPAHKPAGDLFTPRNPAGG
ncbi:hypothetical protein ACTMTI_20635 [Nonomuraea sp. H19]|uniref:hypothetical protein n=1 Tax=Nonomuraea sp. H19 TaxID=3452206 RepID=UPI003F8BF325